QAGKYGFFVVALLNLGLFVAAMKARAWLGVLTTVGGAGSMGYGAVLLARSAVRNAGKAASTATSGAWRLARHGLTGPVRGTPGGPARGPIRGPALPGFKNAGNWLNSRLGTVKTASLDEESPVTATATATRLPPPGTTLVRRAPSAMTHTPGHRPSKADRPVVVEGSVVSNTTTSRPEFPNRRFRDARLHKNIGRTHGETHRHARVWVEKKGVGIASVDPITPRERLSGRRLWRHVQAPSERRIVPPPTSPTSPPTKGRGRRHD